MNLTFIFTKTDAETHVGSKNLVNNFRTTNLVLNSDSRFFERYRSVYVTAQNLHNSA